MNRLSCCGLLFLLWTLTGCTIFTDDIAASGGVVNGGAPDKLVLLNTLPAVYKIGGNAVTEIAVRLIDADGAAVVGVPVSFQAGAALTLLTQTDWTDSDGIAASGVTGVAAAPGSYSLVASTPSSNGEPGISLSLPIVVAPGEPAELRLLDAEPIANTLCGGSMQDASASSSPLWVQIVDEAGNPVAGVLVRFTANDDFIQTSPPLDLTDPLGRAGTTVNTASLAGAAVTSIQITTDDYPLAVGCNFTVIP